MKASVFCSLLDQNVLFTFFFFLFFFNFIRHNELNCKKVPILGRLLAAQTSLLKGLKTSALVTFRLFMLQFKTLTDAFLSVLRLKR